MDERQTIDALTALAADLLDAYEMLSSCLFAGEEITDRESFEVLYALEVRLRVLAPNYPKLLPQESPDITESTQERITRLCTLSPEDAQAYDAWCEAHKDLWEE